MLDTHGQSFFEIIYSISRGYIKENKASLREVENYIKRISSKIKDDEDKNKFKGDFLEIFAEIFFKCFENDPSIGLKEYNLVNIENDYGVDATGINADGRKVAVQVKYRSDPKNLVLYEEMAKTYTSGMLMLDLDLQHENSVYVFTNAIDVTPACQKVLGNRLRIINRDIIADKIDNNKNFWDNAYELTFNTLEYEQGVKI